MKDTVVFRSIWIGGPPTLPAKPGNYLQQDVKKYLHEHPDSKPADIAKALGSTQSNIHKTLRRMEAHGQIEFEQVNKNVRRYRVKEKS